MQRNPDLIRAILLAVEASPTSPATIPGYSDEAVSYHVELLCQAHWLETAGLTWEGHEFLDDFRSDTVWNKTKAFAVEKTGTISVEILKLALPFALKALMAATS
jgi:hypothetical protein